MRIIVPHAGGKNPACVATLEAQAPGVPEYVDVSSRPDAYWHLLRELWEAGGDFLLVEHDDILAPGAVKDFMTCEESDWCRVDNGMQRHGLQVCRWRASFIAAHPRAVSDIQPWMRHWMSFNVPLEKNLGVRVVRREPYRSPPPTTGPYHVHWNCRHTQRLITGPRILPDQRWDSLRQWFSHLRRYRQARLLYEDITCRERYRTNASMGPRPKRPPPLDFDPEEAPTFHYERATQEGQLDG